MNYADVQARQGRADKSSALPFVPGLDAVGTITALGETVSENAANLHLGQRVVCFPVGGSYAEEVLAPTYLTFPVPQEMRLLAGTTLTSPG